MKSKLLYLMIFALAAVSMVGCDDESTAGMTPQEPQVGAVTIFPPEAFSSLTASA